MDLSTDAKRRFSFCAVRERGTDERCVEMIYDLPRLVAWLYDHESQLHDWAIYPASDLSAMVFQLRLDRAKTTLTED